MIELTSAFWSAIILSLFPFAILYDQKAFVASILTSAILYYYYGNILLVFPAAALFLYDQYARRIPTRLRENEGPRSAYGLVPVPGFGSQSSRIGIDVIFVHGLGSNPDHTWTARRIRPQHTDENADICWITDFLPDDVPPSLRKNIRMYFYNYDSYWKRDAVQVQLANFGNNFLHRLKKDIRGTDEERQRHLVFVGHSYGGLVIKRALVQASGDSEHGDIIEHTKAIFFLGTPHRGSNSSTWGMNIAKCLRPVGSNSVLFHEILYDSLTLQNLHDEFVRKCPSLVKVVNFSEERKTRIAKIWFYQLEGFCVKEQSAFYSAPGVHNCSLSVDHSGLNKYRSKEDGNYKIILGNLLSIFNEILPSRRVPYFSVPFRSVFTYAERNNTSSGIAQALARENPYDDKPHALVIHGLGGSGKSQLALKYLESHREQYNAILWIDAESKQTAVASFERCARALGISVELAVTQSNSVHELPVVEKVCQWLEDFGKSNESSLIVFDNVDDPEWGVKKLIPRCSNGSIIITSRDKNSKMLLDGECESIEVGSLDISESRTILFNRLGFKTGRINDNVIRTCNGLANKLGNLALAVDLAGAYISNEDDKIRGLEEYANNFDKQKDYFLKTNELKGLLDTENTVYTVWDKTLQKIRELYPSLDSDIVLTFLSHFRGTIIEYELFSLARACMNEADDFLNEKTASYDEKRQRFPSYEDSWKRFDYIRSFRPLLRYGLLQKVKGNWEGVTMHSLVRWRAKSESQRHPWELWYLEFMICVVLAHDERISEVAFMREIIPHIPGSGFCDRVLPNDLASVSTILLFSCIYERFATYREAIAMYKEAIAIHEKMGSIDDFPPAADCRVRLGGILHIQGRYSEAEQELLKVTKVEPSSPTAILFESKFSHEQLALVYQAQGFHEKAERLLKGTIERRTRLSGPNHYIVINARESLAKLYNFQENWGMFESMLSDLQKNGESQFEFDLLQAREHTLKRQYLAALAILWELWCQCRRDRRSPGYFQFVVRNQINRCLAGQGLFQWAEEGQKDMLERASDFLGPDHLLVAHFKLTLVIIYMCQMQLRKAFELLERVSEHEIKIIATISPDVLQAWEELRKTATKHEEWKELVCRIDRSRQSFMNGITIPYSNKKDEKGKGPAVDE